MANDRHLTPLKARLQEQSVSFSHFSANQHIQRGTYTSLSWEQESQWYVWLNFTCFWQWRLFSHLFRKLNTSWLKFFQSLQIYHNDRKINKKSDRSERSSKISGQCNKIGKNVCPTISFFPVVSILSKRPEKSDRSERSSKISGRFDFVETTEKNLVCPTVSFSVCLTGDRFVGSGGLCHCRFVCYGGRILAVLWPNYDFWLCREWLG